MIQVDLNLIRLLCWAYDEINGHITHNTYNDEFELWEGQNLWAFIYECINDICIIDRSNIDNMIEG